MTQEYLLSTEEFDASTHNAPAAIRLRMHELQATLLRHGLDREGLIARVNLVDESVAPDLLQEIHDAATTLFLLWRRAREYDEEIDTLAIARLFNGLTYAARDLDRRFNLIDKQHIDALVDAVRATNFYSCTPTELAAPVAKAAAAHTHEKAWLWVVLPTFARQPYGRILLAKVEHEAFDYPIFITQPFFISGKTTLFHTHGQNWALSRPLGDDNCQNEHINTVWMPRCQDNAFPLLQTDYSEYCSKDVVVVPPRVIHGISKKRISSAPIPSLETLLNHPTDYQTLFDKTRFGERACLHMYCPCPHTAAALADSPFVSEDDQFFIEFDMIVFDHLQESIWSGGGGSWPRRMIEYGSSGSHCGICYEHDPRKENLDPALVSQWFVQDPVPELIRVRFGE